LIRLLVNWKIRELGKQDNGYQAEPQNIKQRFTISEVIEPYFAPQATTSTIAFKYPQSL